MKNPFPFNNQNPLARATEEAQQNNLAQEQNAQKEQNRNSQISTRFSEIRRLRDKLPSTLGSALFKIVYLPVVAIFPNRNFTDVKKLNEAGLKTYQFPGGELKDYPILANQAILLINFSKFDKMYSDQKNEEAPKSVAGHKEALADWKEAMAKWEKRADDLDQELTEWFEKKKVFVEQRAKYEQYLEDARIFSENPITPAEYRKAMLAYKLGKTKIKPKKLEKPIEVAAPTPLPPQPKKFDAEDYPKPERPKPIKQKFNIDPEEMADVVVELTRDLNEMHNVDYVLMSVKHKANTKSTDGDMICFWLVERWKYKKLEKYGRVTVNSWSFAFD